MKGHGKKLESGRRDGEAKSMSFFDKFCGKMWTNKFHRCGGPRLHSFLGLSQTLSPKARFNTLLGYTAPFDRHDWVVDRCGKRVDYIIDFYAGKASPDGSGKLNFFLDVRPKLNTLEGWKMRAWKVLN